MPIADVAVIGAGLAGLTTAVALAERGARVIVVAEGNGTTHWMGGPVDVAVAPGATSPAEAVAILAARPGHPYARLGSVVGSAMGWFSSVVAEAGLPHAGTIDDSLVPLPTGIGATRPVAIVPESQAAARAPWRDGERLVVAGIAGFKDLWPDAVAASLSRPAVWAGAREPDRVVALTVDLAGATGRHNLNPFVLGHLFDDRDWRAGALDTIARRVDRAGRAPARVALPAVLGRNDHPAVLREAVERLGRPVIEIPLVPPGLPGLRLYQALRRALHARGGRIVLGDSVARVAAGDGVVREIGVEAAAREMRVRAGAFVLATGGVAGGGIVGDTDGRLRETVFGLPVEGPPIEDWLAGNPLDPGDLRIAPAGLRVDAELRPVDPARPEAGPLLENVRVVGSALAGQRYLVERCGDGVAIASARVAAASISGEAGDAADSFASPQAASTPSAASVSVSGERAAAGGGPL
jgi:glycerol-3-phosphate dehydrogenase subunit B